MTGIETFVSVSLGVESNLSTVSSLYVVNEVCLPLYIITHHSTIIIIRIKWKENKTLLYSVSVHKWLVLMLQVVNM